MFLSFGVLLILGITSGILIVFTYRAQRLARLQMEFVTGVSHELRTPLAVISSAAENIEDGIVDQKQLTRYGSAIKSQAKQLIGLVEQILMFASSSDKRHQYQIRSLSVKEVLDAAKHSFSGLLQSAGATVMYEIEDNLPKIRGDLNALTQCLQNLIINAVKYSGAVKWVKIGAQKSGDEIRITVEDHGQGIPSAELPHIFEPFYRGRTATEAQIHGTGLGLPIAKNIAEGLGGRITVTSTFGKGSKFTVHMPIADVADALSPRPYLSDQILEK